MKELIEQIEKLKQQFEQLKPLKPEDQQRLNKKFRLEWNYNSNHIEGNTLTYSETELLLIFGQTKGNHELREYEEMKGHDVALKLIEDLAVDKERTLTENFIREINGIILKEPFYKEAITPDGQPTRRLIKVGEYKSFPNSVRLQNGEMFHYSSPQETPAKMSDLLSWYKEVSLNTSKHPIEVAAELHYRFVCIHPFDDGNGRISRLIMNYHLLKNGFPPVIIKSASKKDYLFALHEADTGNLEAFYKYVAEQLRSSYEICIKAGKGESIEEKGDWEKRITILKKSTANNSKLDSKKRMELLNDTINNTFIPLVKSLYHKLQPLEEFYTNSRYYLTINDTHGVVNSNNFHDILAISSFLKQNSYSIFYSHTLSNFKRNGVETFNSHFNISMKFSDTFYTLSYKNILNTDIKKDYGDNIGIDKIEEITEFIGETILTQIQQNLNKTNAPN